MWLVSIDSLLARFPLSLPTLSAHVILLHRGLGLGLGLAGFVRSTHLTTLSEMNKGGSLIITYQSRISFWSLTRAQTVVSAF